MGFLKDRKSRKRIRESSKDLNLNVVSLGEIKVVIDNFKLHELKLLKAGYEAKVENTKQIGLIAIVVGFFITFYSELIKKLITTDESSSLLMFLVVIVGLLAIAYVYHKLYDKNLLYLRLIELRIKELEEDSTN